jgi:glycosyltransferase involved in cell wall biosynthesis
VAADGLRIAIIGSRGIPARYGGFETFAQELAPRLVARGHEVTVYGRTPEPSEPRISEYRGVRVLQTHALRRRSVEQLSHEFTSILDSGRRRFELYYFLGYRGAPFYLPVQAAGKPIVVHTDGLEWRRRKWNRLGRAYLRVAEWLVGHAVRDSLVCDARAMAEHHARAYGARPTYIPYGAYPRTAADLRTELLEERGLQPGEYYAVICRIEPENNVDLIIREFCDSGSAYELVVVGGMNYVTPYWSALERLASRGRVRLIGPQYGEGVVDSILLGARAYIHGHEVGGTNPILLHAMGCGNLALALDTPFNRENLADTGRYWTKEPGSLAALIQWAEANPDEVARLGAAARERIRARYDWEKVADAHDSFFRAVAARHGIPISQRPFPTDLGAEPSP